MKSALNANIVRSRCDQLSEALADRRLLLGRKDGKLVCGRLAGGGVDPSVAVAGVGEIGLDQLVGEYLVADSDGLTAKQIADLILAQFAIASVAISQ